MSVRAKEKSNRRAQNARHLFQGGPAPDPKVRAYKQPEGTAPNPPRGAVPVRMVEEKRLSRRERLRREYVRAKYGFDARGRAVSP